MQPTDTTFLQYGALGAIVVVLLGLFTWTFRVILMRFLVAFDGMLGALHVLAKEHALHASITTDNHRAAMTAAHTHQAALVDKLEGIKRESRERRNTKGSAG